MAEVDFIVSDYSFFQHKTLEKAKEEMARLSGLHPDKYFRIYRVARHLIAPHAGPKEKRKTTTFDRNKPILRLKKAEE